MNKSDLLCSVLQVLNRFVLIGAVAILDKAGHHVAKSGGRIHGSGSFHVANWLQHLELWARNILTK
jgi:hypothetical protein